MFKFKTGRIIAVACVASLSVFLAACGNSSNSAGQSASTSSAVAVPANADHNAADVTFTQGMIPHHRQAIEMAKLAATRSSNSDVKSLATKIEGAQDPEINTMQGWLKSWGESEMAAGHMDHGMSGMMSDSDMSKLMAASGADFDRQFLTMMTAHHSGAIAMAKTEQSSGKDVAVKNLAGSIATSQTSEIAKMAELLKNI